MNKKIKNAGETLNLIDLNNPFVQLRVCKKGNRGEVKWGQIHPEWTQEATSYLTKIDLTLHRGMVGRGTLQFAFPLEAGLDWLKRMQSDMGSWFRILAGFRIKFGYLTVGGNKTTGSAWTMELPVYGVTPKLNLENFMSVEIGIQCLWDWSEGITRGVNLQKWAEEKTKAGQVITVKDFLEYLKEVKIIKGYEGLSGAQLQTKLQSREGGSWGDIFSVSVWEVLRYYVWPRLGYYWYDIQFRWEDDRDGGGIVISPARQRSESDLRLKYKCQASFTGQKMVLPFAEFSSEAPIWYAESNWTLNLLGINDEDKKDIQVKVKQAQLPVAESQLMTQRKMAGGANNEAPAVPEPCIGIKPVAQVVIAERRNEVRARLANNFKAGINLGYLCPIIQPGDWVQVEGFGGNNLYDGLYWVTTVEHSLCTNWNTKLELIRYFDDMEMANWLGFAVEDASGILSGGGAL